MAVDNETLRALVREFENLANSIFTDDFARKSYLDCAKKLEEIIPKHDWEFYFNGTFCRKCGAPLGDKRECQ